MRGWGSLCLRGVPARLETLACRLVVVGYSIGVTDAGERDRSYQSSVHRIIELYPFLRTRPTRVSWYNFAV